MKNIVWMGLKLCLVVAFVGGIDPVMAGDPIQFFSSARVKSSPIKRIDREMDRALEVPASPDPSQNAYSPADRQRREDQRQAARRNAQLRQREKAAGRGSENWLVEETEETEAGEKEDESLRRLGGENVDEEPLDAIEAGETSMEADLRNYANRQSGQADQQDAMRAAAAAASARDFRSAAVQQSAADDGGLARPADQLDLSGLLRLRPQADSGSPRALGGFPESGSLGNSSSGIPGGSGLQLRPDLSSGGGAMSSSPLFAPGRLGGVEPPSTLDSPMRSTRVDGIDRSGAAGARMNGLELRGGSDGFDTIMRREEMRRLGR